MSDYEFQIKRFPASYPVGPGVPVVTLKEPAEVEAMMEATGLGEVFKADLLEYLAQAKQRPQTSMLAQYENGSPAGQPHVYVVCCIDGSAEPTSGWASFIFPDKGYCRLASAFTDGLFDETARKLEQAPGAQMTWLKGEK